MSSIKKLVMLVLLLAIIGSCAAGFYWYDQNYVMVDFTIYAKNLEHLDLREQEITVKQYEKLRKNLPDCVIQWNVPFQGSAYAQENSSLTITSLSDEDIVRMDYFTKLKTVDAMGCTDYAQLAALQQRRPEVTVKYQVVLGGSAYAPDSEEISIASVSQEELPLLQCFPKLKRVVADGGGESRDIAALQAYCRDKGYDFRLRLGDQLVEETIQELTISGVREGELDLLQFLPKLKTLHMDSPEAPVEVLLALMKKRPDLEITWSATVAGKEFRNTDTLIDISNIEVTDLSVISQEMTYFPEATQLEMHECGVENEEMAAFREQHREDYKVVWTVYLGSKLPTRTDVDNIMPARDGVSNFHDKEAYNMRYCEDVIAIDVGHLDVRNVEFAAFMPHLKYLVISWTGVKDLTPLSNCKELVFLEATDAPVGDLAPLAECTSLEDINVSASGARNSEALTGMTWLKNFWVIKRSDLGYPITKALPNTYVRATGSHTVSGWRSIPNYFAMRDALGMFYMNG